MGFIPLASFSLCLQSLCYAFCSMDSTLIASSILMQYLYLVVRYQLVHECIPYRFNCHCECELLKDGQIYLISFRPRNHGIWDLVVWFVLCHTIYNGYWMSYKELTCCEAKIANITRLQCTTI